MSKIMKIDSGEALRKFLIEVDELHDALLHEAVLLHPGYVGGHGEMYGDAEMPDAQLIFQSQLQDIQAVYIRLKKVSKFNLDFKREFQLEAEFAGGEIVLYPAGKECAEFTELRAKEMEYRILGSGFRGAEYKLVGRGLS